VIQGGRVVGQPRAGVSVRAVVDPVVVAVIDPAVVIAGPVAR
jgi:hypothetical protein